MTKGNTIESVRHADCCACFACVNACPKGCISMRTDESGSLYPSIDQEACVGCGKCLKSCPAARDVPRHEPLSIYAACNGDDELRGASTSGGVATTIANAIVAAGGVVYGAAMMGLEARHVRVDRPDEISRIQGSKYVHSHIGDACRLVKDDLASGARVAFFGTPCQVAGLVGYLGDVPEHLLLIDILCHGVVAHDCFVEGVRLEHSAIGEVANVTFRDGNRYCLKGYDVGGRVLFETPYRASWLLNGFVEGLIFRENCYSCKFAGAKRCGDITLGDFWGLKSGFDTSKGVNFVAINTAKGHECWESIKGVLRYERHALEEAAPFNHPLRKPADKPAGYEKFKAIYALRGGRAALLHAYTSKVLFILLRRMARRNRALYRVVTSVPVVGNKLKEYAE